MKKHRLNLYILTAVLVAAASVSGCSKQDSGGKQPEGQMPPGWQQDAEEPVTLDWYINFSWYATPWGENAVSKKITEDTGVSVNFKVPAGSEAEKLDSMISSDTLPELITLGWWEPQVQKMMDEEMVYALSDLADQYDPYFYQVSDGRVRDWYTRRDGKLYCYPSTPITPEDYEKNKNLGSNQTFLVRKDIYEAIGSPDMTTPEGFSAAVEKAVKMFPEVDGEPLIPIGADEFTVNGCNTFDKYLQNFLAVPYEKDGKFYDRYTDPEYIRWLKVFRQLNKEGYLSDHIFIDKRAQMEEKIAKGQYFCMLYQWSDIQTQQKILYAKDPGQIYMAVDGPKNSREDDPQLPNTGINGWTVTFITKNCSNPDRAIRLMSYMLSEYGQKIIYLGIEGVTYDMQNGKPVLRPDVEMLLNTDRMEYDRKYGADDAYWMLQNNVMQLQWASNLKPPMAQLQEWTYPYTVYTGQYDIIFDRDSEEENINNKITYEWGRTLPKLLLARSDGEFDGLMRNFIEKRNKYGYNKIVEESTRQMNEAKVKLGLQ